MKSNCNHEHYIAVANDPEVSRVWGAIFCFISSGNHSFETITQYANINTPIKRWKMCEVHIQTSVRQGMETYQHLLRFSDGIYRWLWRPEQKPYPCIPNTVARRIVGPCICETNEDCEVNIDILMKLDVVKSTKAFKINLVLKILPIFVVHYCVTTKLGIPTQCTL